MTRRFSAYAALACTLLAPLAPAAPEKWAPSIEAFARADAAHPPAPGGVVFVGSSSIVKWKTLARDFPGVPVINRGFGGSELADSVYYADRIVLPYKPRLVVVYAGENDLSQGAKPEAVAASFSTLCAKVHAALPQTRIVFIGLKPSPSRWKLREAMIQANTLIAAQCAQDERLGFVDVFGPMLDANGQPRSELFLDDKLHLNAAGYELWTRLVAPRLK